MKVLKSKQEALAVPKHLTDVVIEMAQSKRSGGNGDIAVALGEAFAQAVWVENRIPSPGMEAHKFAEYFAHGIGQFFRSKPLPKRTKI